MADVYTFEFRGMDFVYLGYVGEVLDFGHGLGKCLDCGEYAILPDENLQGMRNRIKSLSIEGKLADEKLVNSIVFEIERVKGKKKDTSKRLTKLVNKLLNSLN